jgi:hypothetical protein
MLFVGTNIVGIVVQFLFVVVVIGMIYGIYADLRSIHNHQSQPEDLEESCVNIWEEEALPIYESSSGCMIEIPQGITAPPPAYLPRYTSKLVLLTT